MKFVAHDFVSNTTKVSSICFLLLFLACENPLESLRDEWTYLGRDQTFVESQLTELGYSGRPGRIWHNSPNHGVHESVLVRYDSGRKLIGILHSHESTATAQLDSIFDELSKYRNEALGAPLVDSSDRTGFRLRRWVLGSKEETKWVEVSYLKGINVLAYAMYARDSSR